VLYGRLKMLRIVLSLCLLLPNFIGAEDVCIQRKLSALESSISCKVAIVKYEDMEIKAMEGCIVEVLVSSEETVRGTCAVNMPKNIFDCDKNFIHYKSADGKVDVNFYRRSNVQQDTNIKCQLDRS